MLRTLTDSNRRVNRLSFVSVLLVVVLLVGTGIGTVAADAPDCSTVSYSGDGTEISPYEVSNVDQLQCIESQGLSSSYELVSDIDASETSTWNTGKGFMPVGRDPEIGTQFTGTFDGNGHTITSLTIIRGSRDEVALFGQVGSGATVRDVSLENVNIVGVAAVGALIGDNVGGTVEGVSASGSVTGSSYSVGGLVGYSSGTVTQSSSTAEVTGGDDDVGGLVGVLDSGTVSQSFATGSVSVSVDGSYNNGAGGLVGDIDGGTVTDSYARGDVSGDDDGVGGLVGDGGGTVARSYSTGSVSATHDVGGLIGSGGTTVTNSYWDTQSSGLTDSFGGTGLTTNEMIGNDAPDNMGGFSFSSPDTWKTVQGDYPILTWQIPDLISINSPDTAQPDGDFDFTVEMEESSVGEVAVESSDFDVSLSVVDDSGDDIGAQTDTSVEFIDLDEETSTYTLNVDITGGSEGDTGSITAATGGSIDGSGVDDQTSTAFSLETTTESPVEDVPDDLWAAVTQDDGNEGLSLADLGNAIQQYQANPGNADVGGVDIGLSQLGSLIQYYQNVAA